METVFSGIQPSGELHLGNYLGAVRTWVELQQSYRCFYCIVDYHAITQPYEPAEMSRRVREMAIDLLACGVDPERATLFVQSAVPEHTELAWALSSVTPHGELGRMTQFKDKSEHQPDNINAGIFTYPMLQAADIAALRRDPRAGRRGPAPAPGAGARDRAALERALRRHLRRAAAAVLDDAQAAGARRAVEDVEEPAATPSACASPRRRSGTSCARRRPIRRARGAPTRAIPTTATSSRCTSSSPAPSGRRRSASAARPPASAASTARSCCSRGSRSTSQRIARARRRAARRRRAGSTRSWPRARRARGRWRARRWRACASGWALRRRSRHDVANGALRGVGRSWRGAAVAAGGCSTRDDGSSPESAVQPFSRRRARAIARRCINRFGPRTRAHIDELLGVGAQDRRRRACCARRTS